MFYDQVDEDEVPNFFYYIKEERRDYEVMRTKKQYIFLDNDENQQGPSTFCQALEEKVVMDNLHNSVDNLFKRHVK